MSAWRDGQEQLQVLVVTHSPQVAARGAQHLQVAKAVRGGKAETRVLPLDAPRGARKSPACWRARWSPGRAGMAACWTGSRDRRAEGRDAAALAALLRALNTEPGLHPERITAQRVARDLIADARVVLLVTEEAGLLEGFVSGHPYYDSRGQPLGLHHERPLRDARGAAAAAWGAPW